MTLQDAVRFRYDHEILSYQFPCSGTGNTDRSRPRGVLHLFVGKMLALGKPVCYPLPQCKANIKLFLLHHLEHGRSLCRRPLSCTFFNHLHRRSGSPCYFFLKISCRLGLLQKILPLMPWIPTQWMKSARPAAPTHFAEGSTYISYTGDIVTAYQRE
jgi:hypothetical protein